MEGIWSVSVERMRLMLQRRKISGQSCKGNATDITFVEDICSEIIGARARDTKFVEGIWSGIEGKMLLT